MNIQQVRHIMEDLGAYGHGSFWKVETPAGPLEWHVSMRGRSPFALVSVDRFSAEHDAPPHGRAWAEKELWPIIRAGAETSLSRTRRAYAHALPGCQGTFSQCHVSKDQLEQLLRAWVPQETAWQVEAAGIST